MSRPGRVTFSASIELVERSIVILREEASLVPMGGLAAALMPYIGHRNVLITVELEADALPAKSGGAT